MPRKKRLILPVSLYGVRQVRKAIQSLDKISDQFVTEKVRVKAGVDKVAAPIAVPRDIEDIVRTNKITLKNQTDVVNLKKELEEYIADAPRAKFTFASQPEDDILMKICSWVRENIHAYTLIDSKVAPSIAGGFHLTTPTRRYDFTWKSRISAQNMSFADYVSKTPGVTNAK